MTMKKTLVAALCMFAATHALAGGIEQLHQFLNGTRTARATFTQNVISKSGKAGQKASGSMLFQRPGKFRWTYEKPYSQLIVGDGSKLWTWDKDLNQVVVKPMGSALGASPAALLAGDDDLDKNFTLKDAGEQDGLAWLDATPKTTEAGFERVRIGFKGGLPQAMEVRDNFGQTTMLTFASFERNPSLGADNFRFTPPKGADVVGE
ncbi:outer membrane lipoprotein chaperone LolA [Viridibacterium curvum]|uniref:Outer-membrane lipoprotein carrier protein n=2 Tax=Viridibacterium curvum TaxID=1101404 RepID=A0ABP9QBQ4_9RHOO